LYLSTHFFHRFKGALQSCLTTLQISVTRAISEPNAVEITALKKFWPFFFRQFRILWYKTSNRSRKYNLLALHP